MTNPGPSCQTKRGINLCVFYFQYQEELQAEMDRWLEEKEHEMQDILSKKKEVGIKM